MSPGHLSSDDGAVICAILHLKGSICTTRVNISIGKSGNTEYQSPSVILNSDSAYTSYEIMANRSREPSCSVFARTHGAVHMPGMGRCRFVSSIKVIGLPKVLIQEKSNAWTAASSPVESQMHSKVMYITKFKSGMPREVGSHHFGMMRYLYRVFWALNLPNMAMIHWIMIHHGEVDHRLPAEKYACWKKRQKASLALNIYEWNLSDC